MELIICKSPCSGMFNRFANHDNTEEPILPPPQQHKTLCLNMIVKNEAHIIRKTLAMLCDKIVFDYWVICDTGSTDETPQIIRDFFQQKQIQGELHIEPWVDFAHNRTDALQKAFNKTDFLLVFDADDVIHGACSVNEAINKDVSVDGYQLKFGNKSGDIAYTRVQLINNHIEWKYRSVLHEFIVCTNKAHPKIKLLEGDYFIESGRTGSRNKNPNKYLDDARILEKAYEEAKQSGDDLYLRYAFYCANSFKDAGRWEDAIRWYKITLQQPNWAQEKYMACISLYQCFCAINPPQSELGVYYLVESCRYDAERAEGIYELVKYYCVRKMYSVAYSFYQHYAVAMAMTTTPLISSKLFLDPSKRDFYLPYYMIIVAYYSHHKELIPQMLHTICTKRVPVFDEFYVGNFLFNARYCFQQQQDINLSDLIQVFNEYLTFLQKSGYPLWRHANILREYEKYGIINTTEFMPPRYPNSKFTEEDCKASCKILFYTGYSVPKWNYLYALSNALGGSETAVAFLAHELAKMNMNISEPLELYIAGDVAENNDDNSETNILSVRYINFDHLEELLKENAFHTIVVVRYISFYELYQYASFYKSYIWAHDTMLLNYGQIKSALTSAEILQKWTTRINGCIVQTAWHKKKYQEQYPSLNIKSSQLYIINNGILPELFVYEPVKIANRFIYSSCPERGLGRLLELWPDIIAEIPGAELCVCTYTDFPRPNNTDDAELFEIMQRFPSSVHFYGKLSKAELYGLLSSCEYWLYPSTYPETSCITALEMLASNVICIYYPTAGLTDTLCVNNQHYGIPCERGNELRTILELTNRQKQQLIAQGANYALQECSWENRARQWWQLLTDGNLANPLAVGSFAASRFMSPSANLNQTNTQDIQTLNRVAKQSLLSTKKLAIFNSFPFHYEMFGFILYYAKMAGYMVDIYTNTKSSLGWLDFYRENEMFKGVFEIIPYLQYQPLVAAQKYAYIFLTTDDDAAFEKAWFTHKVIVINHVWQVRNTVAIHYLKCARFKNVRLAKRDPAAQIPPELDYEYTYPCYPIITRQQKQTLLAETYACTNEIRICIVGGGEIHRGTSNYSWKAIERFCVLPTDTTTQRIVVHFIARDINEKKTLVAGDNGEGVPHKMEDLLKEGKNNNHATGGFVEYRFSSNMDTKTMINTLLSSHYMFLSFSDSYSKNNGISASGAIQLAYSTLCIPIIDKTANRYLGLSAAYEIDLYSNESNNAIYVQPDGDLLALEQERQLYVDKLAKYMATLDAQTSAIPKKIYATWETKTLSPEFREKVLDTWIQQPGYEFQLFDAAERDQFIRENFDAKVYMAYRRIIPGAFRADLFRYCLLYKCGGIAIDIDMQCLGQLDDFLVPGVDFVVPIDLNKNRDEGQHNLVSAFMAAVPGHPVFLHCIERIVDQVKRDVVPLSRLDITGPGVLGRAMNRFLEREETATFNCWEGFYGPKKVHFLGFELGTEYIKNLAGQVLCQNKNGNKEIQHLYAAECAKLPNYVSWVRAQQVYLGLDELEDIADNAQGNENIDMIAELEEIRRNVPYEFFYGTKENNRCITLPVLEYMYEDGQIVIPRGDDERADLFGDPCFGVVKKIFVGDKRTKKLREYGEDVEVRVVV